MSRSDKSYFVLFVFFASSLFATSLSPVADIVKIFLSLPGLAAVGGTVFQLYRDSKAHERSLDIQARHQDFDLGVASHMANVAFDRHVAFCEAYLGRLMLGLSEIMTASPGVGIAALGSDLADIRRAHLAWVASDTDLLLSAFEQLLRKTGTLAHVLKSIEVSDTRTKLVEEMFSGLTTLQDTSEPADDPARGLASARIIGNLRKLLGIEELTTLRKDILSVAIDRIAASRQ